MKSKKLSRIGIICGAVLMFLLALGITLYPLLSTMYNEKHASEIHTQYEEIIQQVDNSLLVEARQRAEEYNAAIVPGTREVDAFSQESLVSAAEDYDSQLNVTGDGLMGYIEIPRIQVNLPIHHGTDTETLDAGAGHVLGTSLPVGGTSTHSVISAHSGVATKKLFSDLDKLVLGDVFYLQILGETLAYQVDEINTVLPHDASKLGIIEGGDYCTLVTCVPFGVNSHRLLVRGTRIPYEKAEEIVEVQEQTEAPPASTWVEQYVRGILFGIGVVVFLCLLFWFLRRRKARHETK